MHHIHLHFGHHPRAHGVGRLARQQGSTELFQARRELKTALAVKSVGRSEEQERLIGILKRATAEILGV